MADVVLNQKRLMIVASSVVVLTMVGMLFLGRWNLGPKEESAESAAETAPAVEEMVDETVVDDDFQAEPPVESGSAKAGMDAKSISPEPEKTPVLEDKPSAAPAPLPAAETSSPQPEPESKAESTAPWTLQVGAFSSEDSARSITRILKNNGHKAWYKPKDGLYKVFVGRYASRDAAVAQRDGLEASMRGIQQVPDNRPFPVQE